MLQTFYEHFGEANLKLGQFVGDFDGHLACKPPTLCLCDEIRRKEERKKGSNLSPCFFFVQPVILTFSPLGE